FPEPPPTPFWPPHKKDLPTLALTHLARSRFLGAPMFTTSNLHLTVRFIYYFRLSPFDNLSRVQQVKHLGSYKRLTKFGLDSQSLVDPENCATKIARSRPGHIRALPPPERSRHQATNPCKYKSFEYIGE